MKKTKIVCTIGPASEDKKILTHLIASGMNVARLNFSHGDYDEHKMRIQAIKEIREKLAEPIAIMLDTKGPEIRIKQFKDGGILLKEGHTFALKQGDEPGDESGIAVTYKSLAKEVKKGDTILIDDGLISLTVKEINGADVICRVENGGELKNNKSINIPNVNIQLPALTEKDINDLRFGIDNEVDYVAASFIRSKSDVIEIRRVLEEHGGEEVNIISKIENRQGVDNIDEIIEASDGIMVARGDLGVEIPPEEVPIVQKDIIRKCNRVGKPVITATQMLDSMIKNPRATRAEVADVANAIFDGTDAIMLSGETAAGKYPINAVQTMAMIAEKTESNFELDARFNARMVREDNVTNAISQSTCRMSEELNSRAIITPTGSGYTARMVSKYRPKANILAYSDKQNVCRRLSLVWGVKPMIVEEFSEVERIHEKVMEDSQCKGFVKEGDLVIITTGLPLGVHGTTNSIRIETVGKYVLRGNGIGKDRVKGKIRIFDKNLKNFEDGDILALHEFNAKSRDFFKRAGAVVTTEKGLSSDTAIVAINYGIPALVGVKSFDGYDSGEVVILDALRGILHKTEI